jgi:hypothetical protein
MIARNPLQPHRIKKPAPAAIIINPIIIRKKNIRDAIVRIIPDTTPKIPPRIKRMPSNVTPGGLDISFIVKKGLFSFIKTNGLKSGHLRLVPRPAGHASTSGEGKGTAAVLREEYQESTASARKQIPVTGSPTMIGKNRNTIPSP